MDKIVIAKKAKFQEGDPQTLCANIYGEKKPMYSQVPAYMKMKNTWCDLILSKTTLTISLVQTKIAQNSQDNSDLERPEVIGYEY